MNADILNDREIATARACMDKALAKGVSKIRVTVCKSTMDLVGTLDGAIDKITHCLDRSLNVNLFVDGRYGAFSTNRCEESELDGFLDKAISTVRLLSPDECRDLPAANRIATDAGKGYELGLYDPAIEGITPAERVSTALAGAVFHSPEARGEGYELISEEGEYSDGVYDTLILDSEGAYCRHIETSFEYGVEVTIRDAKGRRYSSYWWDSATHKADMHPGVIGQGALSRAVRQMNPKGIRGGKYNVVIDRECASRMVSPVLNALNGYSLQQHNSFLQDSLGKRVFPEGLTIMDMPHIKGQSGSRLFDSEGAATRQASIIENGVVRQYSINTYMANKMGMTPTIEDFSRPAVMPYPRSGMQREDILRLCGEGALITGFNGGNSNAATGDFSYGIEGFLFKDGQIVHPIKEMVLTGNFLSAWSHMIACGDDARPCQSRLVPTLAFSDMDINA